MIYLMEAGTDYDPASAPPPPPPPKNPNPRPGPEPSPSPSPGIEQIDPDDFTLTELGNRLKTDEFRALQNNIAKHGITEPIRFVLHAGRRFVVDGHHRLRAAQNLGLDKVPAQQVTLPYKGFRTLDDLF